MQWTPVFGQPTGLNKSWLCLAARDHADTGMTDGRGASHARRRIVASAAQQ
jgi:hypothetical protein